MTRPEIIEALDQEILRLHHAKELLKGTSQLSAHLGQLIGTQQPHRQRTISAEGRKRIAEAQKRRWAREKGSKKSTNAQS